MSNSISGGGYSPVLGELLNKFIIEDISSKVIPLSGGILSSCVGAKIDNRIYIVCNLNFPNPVVDGSTILKLKDLPAPNIPCLPVQISDRDDNNFLYGKAFLSTDDNLVHYVTSGSGMKYAYITIDYIHLSKFGKI